MNERRSVTKSDDFAVSFIASSAWLPVLTFEVVSVGAAELRGEWFAAAEGEWRGRKGRGRDGRGQKREGDPSRLSQSDDFSMHCLGLGLCQLNASPETPTKLCPSLPLAF